MTPPRRRLLAALIPLSLALAACGGKDPSKDNDPPPPDLASNFAGPIDGLGVAPDWSLRIRGTQLTVSRTGQPEFAGVAPGAEITAHTASWTAKLRDSRSMTVKLYGSPCTVTIDGPSYPMAVEIDLPGSAPLSGCAGPAGKAAATTQAAPAKP